MVEKQMVRSTGKLTLRMLRIMVETPGQVVQVVATLQVCKYYDMFNFLMVNIVEQKECRY